MVEGGGPLQATLLQVSRARAVAGRAFQGTTVPGKRILVHIRGTSRHKSWEGCRRRSWVEPEGL